MQPKRFAIWAIVLLAALLRFTGLDWSVDPADGTFHRFHPDEGTLLDNASWITRDFSEVKSAYGQAPVYLLSAIGRASGLILGFDAFDLANERSERLSYLVARGLNATLGTLTVFLVFLLSHRAGGTRVGLVAAALLAVSPGHIQQCHYYTVDAGLAFWVTLSLYLIVLLPSRSLWKHILIGLAVGMAGGYRFIAGLLALPYIAAHLWHRGDRSLPSDLSAILSRARELIGLNTVLCGLMALLVTLVSYPTFLLDPSEFFAADDQRDFLPSVDVATGKALRLWNLYDFKTTPYLFYLTDLLPAALGMIAALVALVGVLTFFSRPSRLPLILITWLVAYFALTGGLFTKPIRYTAPMLPMLCCLAAYAWDFWSSRFEKSYGTLVRYALVVAILVPTAVHGTSVWRVYTRENVRFEARRWIHENASKTSPLMAENGGFPTLWMVDGHYPLHTDPGSLFMRTQNHVLPANIVDILHETVGKVDTWVMIPHNRAIPYTSAPETYPLAADFYKRLRYEELGWERVARFERPASFLGIDFDKEGSDPTITGFDRPAVEVYQKTDDYPSRWAAWQESVRADERYPDTLLSEGIRQYSARNFRAALRTFEKTIEQFPDFKLAQLCRVETIYRMGDAQRAVDVFEEAKMEAWDFAGLTLAGIPDRGAEYTLITQEGKPDTNENLYLRQIAAKAFNRMGLEAQEDKDFDKAATYYEKSLQMSTRFLLPYRNLGMIYLNRGDYQRSRDAYQKATGIDRTISDIWVGLAIAESYLGNAKGTYESAMKALRLAPNDTRYLPILRELVDFVRKSGRADWAEALESRIPSVSNRAGP